MSPYGEESTMDCLLQAKVELATEWLGAVGKDSSSAFQFFCYLAIVYLSLSVGGWSRVEGHRIHQRRGGVPEREPPVDPALRCRLLDRMQSQRRGAQMDRFLRDAGQIRFA